MAAGLAPEPVEELDDLQVQAAAMVTVHVDHYALRPLHVLGDVDGSRPCLGIRQRHGALAPFDHRLVLGVARNEAVQELRLTQERMVRVVAVAEGPRLQDLLRGYHGLRLAMIQVVPVPSVPVVAHVLRPDVVPVEDEVHDHLVQRLLLQALPVHPQVYGLAGSRHHQRITSHQEVSITCSASGQKIFTHRAYPVSRLNVVW